MIIIGEKINATRKAINAAISARDEVFILETARQQIQAGANYLDVNGGSPDPKQEVANMEWLVGLLQANFGVPLCIDSANPRAMQAGLSLAKAKPIMNSISLEKERLGKFLPTAGKFDCMVVALCMSDAGMPCGVDDRVERAALLVEKLVGAGKKLEDIIIDPCFLPVSAQPEDGKKVCQAIAQIKQKFPQVHVGGGLSNASFGLPERRLINLAMVASAVFNGMDVALVDPCAPGMVAMILATEVVSGADSWCANYVSAYRAGRFGKPTEKA